MTVSRNKKQHPTENLGFLVAKAFSKEFDSEKGQSVSKGEGSSASAARSKQVAPNASVKPTKTTKKSGKATALVSTKQTSAPATQSNKAPAKASANPAAKKAVTAQPAYRVRVRKIGREIHVTYEGRAQSLREWATELGIAHHTLYQRIAVLDIPVREAFTRPVQSRTPRKAAKKLEARQAKPVYEDVPTPHNEELNGRLFRLGRQYFILYKRQYRSISDLAQEKGIDSQTLRVRVLKSAMSFKDILKP